MTEAVESSMGGDPQSAAIPGPLLPDARGQLAELGAALTARDHVMAFVGHELRNALSPLQLLVDQFAGLAGDPRAWPGLATRAELVTRNLRSVIVAISWVTEIADLCRGAVRFDRSTCDLAEIARDVCRELGDDAAAHGAELVVEAARPVAGWWDRARLKQVVGHLVSNAIHHAGGCVEIRITDRGGDAEVAVRDHGPGLEPSALAQLCDPFDPDRRRRPGGPGVGLWVVKTLTAMMRGSVAIQRCVDGGACFCVVVPRG